MYLICPNLSLHRLIYLSLYECLIPGFVPTVKQTSSKSGLKEWHAEWQWEFVRMQQFLLKSLNHPQTRFFLFVILMFRTHLKETTSIDESFLRFVLDFFHFFLLNHSLLCFVGITFSGCWKRILQAGKMKHWVISLFCFSSLS